MSDTSTPDWQDPAIVDNAPAQPIWTPDQLKVALDPKLLKLAEGQTGLSAAKARSLIEDRLSQYATTTTGVGKAIEDIADLIVQTLPAEAMNATVVQSIDLRPYLAQVEQSPLRFGGYDAGHRYGNFQQFAHELLQGQQTGAEAVARETNTNLGRPPESGLDTIRQFETDMATISPEARANQASAALGAGGTTAEAAATSIYDPNADLFTQQLGTPTFPESEYKQLIDIPSSAFDSIIDAERQFNEDNKLTPGTMQTGIVYDYTQGAGTSSSTVTHKKMSLTSALDLPNTLTYEQLAGLQTKLAAAGYFDRVGQTFVEGEATDPATQKAWELALIDAYRSPNTGVVQLLAKKGAEYRDIARKRNLAAAAPFDSDVVRASADSMAQELIGRRLTAEEYTRVRGSLLQLRKERLGNQVTGLDNTSWKGDATTAQYGFNGDDINARIQREFGGEARAQGSWDAGQALYKSWGMDFPGAATADTVAAAPPKPANAPSRTNV